MKIKPILIFSITLLVGSTNLNGQFHGFKTHEYYKNYENKIQNQTDEEIKLQFLTDIDFRELKIILNNFEERKSINQIQEIKNFIYHYESTMPIREEEMKNHRTKNSALGHYKELIAFMKVELAKKETNGDEYYVLYLDKLAQQGIQNKEWTLIKYISKELYSLENDESIKVLRKHEGSDKTIFIKMYRIKAETRNLNPIESLKYCLRSARETIQLFSLESHPNLSPEYSNVNSRLDIHESVKLIQKEKVKAYNYFPRNSIKWKMYMKYLSIIEYRYLNPKKITNPIMNPEIGKIYKRYEI